MIGRFEIATPEWPSSTLRGFDFMDLATRAPLFRPTEKNAVAIGVFGEAIPKANAAQVFPGQPIALDPEVLGDRRDFLLGHPNVTRFAATAITALLALERQATRVPFALVFFGHNASRCEAVRE